MFRIYAIIALCVCFNAHAQNISPTVVANNGGSGSIAGRYMSFTMGQPMILGGSGQYITDGFQQSWGVASQNERVKIAFVSAHVTQPGQDVEFNGTINTGSYISYKWTFAGIKTADSINTSTQNPKFKVFTPGTYTAVLAVETSAGVWEKSAPLIFSVVGIKQNDTSVCFGRTVTLQTNATTGTFVWDNGSTDALYNITAEKTKWYKISINKTLVDSVLISVYAPIDLGKDTALCVGQSITFNFLEKFGSCKWNKETDIKLINTFSTPGQIKATAIDNHGCLTIDSMTILPSLPLPSFSLGRDTAICPNTNIVLKASNGTNYKWSDNSTADKITVTKEGIYIVTVTGANKCSAVDTIKVSTLTPFPEQIGTVSIDSSTSKSILIAWNRHQNKRTHSYVVQRYSADIAAWVRVDSIPFSANSLVFETDNSVNFNQRSYRYRLLTYDSVCFNHVSSNIHSTIQLTTSLTIDPSTKKQKVNLGWNRYEGYDGLQFYKIIRIASNGSQKILDTKESSESYLTYTDFEPLDTATYKVAFTLPYKVEPQGLFKTDTGPFSQSLSNVSEANLVQTPQYELQSISIDPNPATINVQISAQPFAEITITTETGTTQFVGKTDAFGKLEIGCATWTKGFYFVKIATANHQQVEKLLIN